MITERDKEILRWVERYKSITIDQCSKLFFSNSKMSYDLSRKRLRYLNKEGLIKRYRKDPRSETIYFIEKRLKIHDLKIMDVIIALYKLNGNYYLFQRKFEVNRFVSYIVDASIICNKHFPVIVEVDYTHYTSNKKITDIINYLENKHRKSYIFLIIRQTIEKISISDVGAWSKLIFVNWNFNNSDELDHSLRSLFGM